MESSKRHRVKGEVALMDRASEHGGGGAADADRPSLEAVRECATECYDHSCRN